MKCVVPTSSCSFKGGPEVIIYCSVVGGGPHAGKLFLLQETVSKINLSSNNVLNQHFALTLETKKCFEKQIPHPNTGSLGERMSLSFAIDVIVLYF